MYLQKYLLSSDFLNHPNLSHDLMLSPWLHKTNIYQVHFTAQYLKNVFYLSVCLDLIVSASL